MTKHPLHIFEKLAYPPFSPKVGIARGSKIITRSGVVLLSRKWTPASIYSGLHIRIHVLFVLIASLATRRLVVMPKDQQFGIVHSTWTAGYYHWLTESLPRALAIHEAYPKATILLPSEKYQHYAETLRCLGIENIAFFPEGANVRIDAPVLSECPRKFATTSPALLKKVRNIILEKGAFTASQPPDKIIYISRRKARGRFIQNEEALEAMLAEFGAESVCLEDFSFKEQVALMHRTRLLISIHGAGLTNMMFMQEGGTVIEILPRKNGIFDYKMSRNTSFNNACLHDACYVRLAEALNLEYQYLESDPDNKWYSGTHMANLNVELGSLKKTIENSILIKNEPHE